MGAYDSRWREAITGTKVGISKTETVYNFIKAFKSQFDGNGPVLEEITRMLAELYEIKAPDKKIGSYYINKLVERGLIETEATKDGEDLQRSPGRIMLKRGCWTCWEADQGPGSDKDNEAITGAVQKQDTIESNGDLVGQESLL